VASWLAVFARGAGQAIELVRKDELPFPGPNPIKAVVPVVVEVVPRWLCILLPGKERPDVVAVDNPVCRSRTAGELGKSRQHIHSAGKFLADGTRRNLSRPADQARFALATFPGGSLSLSQLPGRTGVVAVTEPGAVVAGKQNQRVLVQPVLLESREDLADAP